MLVRKRRAKSASSRALFSFSYFCPGSLQSVIICPGSLQSVIICPGSLQSVIICPGSLQSVIICPGSLQSVIICPGSLQSVIICSGSLQSVIICLEGLNHNRPSNIKTNEQNDEKKKTPQNIRFLSRSYAQVIFFFKSQDLLKVI